MSVWEHARTAILQSLNNPKTFWKGKSNPCPAEIRVLSSDAPLWRCIGRFDDVKQRITIEFFTDNHTTHERVMKKVYNAEGGEEKSKKRRLSENETKKKKKKHEKKKKANQNKNTLK